MKAGLTRRAFLQVAASVIVLPKSVFSQDSVQRFSIPVLLYHDISNEIKDNYTVTPGHFAAQMEWLFQNGYRAISFRDTETLPSLDKAIIITFDDGYASFIAYAFQIFQSYGFKATINIIGEHVNMVLQDAAARPMLSWDEYRYLASSGLISLGCHTDRLHNFRHRGVTGVSEETLLQDLKEFQERLIRELGTAPDIIAWPYGLYNEKSISIARRAGFRYILTSNEGLYKTPDESARIPRKNVDGQASLTDFKSILGAV